MTKLNKSSPEFIDAGEHPLSAKNVIRRQRGKALAPKSATAELPTEEEPEEEKLYISTATADNKSVLNYS